MSYPAAGGPVDESGRSGTRRANVANVEIRPAGRRVLVPVQGELDLNAAARRIEETMLGRLRALAEKAPAIGDVRGRGAMLAVELVEPGTTTPNPALAGKISAGCHQNGVLTLTCGTYGNVQRFLPPLVMPDHLLAEALDVIEEVTLGLA